MTARRILFLGQKPIGEAAWARLRERERHDFRVVAACSNADAERVWWRSNAIVQTRRGVEFVDNASRNDGELRRVARELDVNLILCVHHPWILEPGLLRSVSYEAITFHNAKLPAYRGFNAVNHALLNRDATFTCTAHYMADEVDTGDLIFEASFPIEEIDTARSLYAKAHHACLRLFDQVLDRLLDGEPLPQRRLEGEGRFYPRASIEVLREVESADELPLKARAFFFPPFEPAYVVAGGRRYHVLPPDALDGSLVDPSRARRGLDLAIAAAGATPVEVSA